MKSFQAVLLVTFWTYGCVVGATTYAAPDCTGVECPALRRCNLLPTLRVRHGQKFEKVTPSGRCCPICVQTEPVPVVCNRACIRLQCEDDEIEYKAPTECCAKCIPRGPVGPGSAGNQPLICNVACVLLQCKDDEMEYKAPNECCAKCVPKSQEGTTETQPDCSAVSCPAPDCDNPYTPNGECCNVCPPAEVDCRVVLCAQPDCVDPYTPEGQCCPICPTTDVVDCSGVRCMNPECDPGYESVVPPGSCCPVCQLKDGCHEVQCIKAPCYPVCDDDESGSPTTAKCRYGYELVVPPGSTAPVCQLKDGCHEVQCKTAPCDAVCDDDESGGSPTDEGNAGRLLPKCLAYECDRRL